MTPGAPSVAFISSQASRLIVAWRSSLYTNSFYLMAANAVNAAFGFVFWATAARLYHPQDVGLAAAAVSAVGLLSALSLLGLDYALIRFLPHSRDPLNTIGSSLAIGMGAALVLSSVFVGGLNIWAPALGVLRQSAVLVGSIIIATVCGAVTGLLSSLFLSKCQAGLSFAQASTFSVVKVAFVLILAATADAEGLIGAWAVGMLAAAACGIALLLPRVEGVQLRRLRLAVGRGEANDMVRFAFANYVTTVLWGAPAFLLPLLVVSVVGPETNAYFYVAFSVSGLLAMIPMAVSMSLFAHGSYDEGQLVQHTVDSLRLSLALLAPAVGVVLVFGGKILLLFGRPYSAQATDLLRLLAVSTLPMAANFLFFSVRRVQQRMGGVVVSTMWILGASLALSAVLLPRLGLVGVGVAWFVAHASAAAVIVARYLVSR